MNFYRWHVGDYISHTADLEPMQDLAYRRLLDWFYLNEKPIPTEVSKAAGKVRLRDNEPDVEFVLREFFTLTADGWTQKRAEEELEQMQAMQDEAATREEGKQTRLQRFRQRRKVMFAALAKVGIVPAWNIKHPDLLALFEVHCGPPDTVQSVSGLPYEETAPETAPETTSNATRTVLPTPIPTPLPTTNSSKPINLAVDSGDALAPAADLLGHVLNGNEKTKPVPDCPHLEVLALWAEVMPDLPQHDPNLWGGTRADHLRARWRATAAEKRWESREQGLAFMRKFFVWCRQSEFLMGKVPSRDRAPFEFELAWLVNPTNWAKAREGKYHAKR